MYKEKTIPVYIKEIYQETNDVKRFILASVEGKLLPRFNSGAHIATYLKREDGFIIRQYSLTSNPDKTDQYQIAVRLSNASKGGSLFWHEQIKVGDELHISYPKNDFPLSFKAKHHVFYAAGIGITPFLSMIQELSDKGSSFELHYASKSKEVCAFYDYLRKHFSNQSHFYFSKQHNRVSTSSLEKHPIGTHIYFCGPVSFIQEFTEAALGIGYPKSSIHLEHFVPVQPMNVEPFQVITKNGEVIQVAKEQTLLEALLHNNVEAPYSCRMGRCGTCEIPVLKGEIDHCDSFLTEDQKNAQRSILTCVSRAKSGKLVIGI
ncbi:PDR/VanB family oxidoreductase [Fictibacillus nanhaiensis]|uniref:PDR/VanB family oxidoreductase n=1 Tax=Fictibacillus nanhaiensis TaxID=742169 RepID=UPI001FEA88E3|nr:PDR/VanB family oxidoreductase [Fictibacillus nanhaiensis]